MIKELLQSLAKTPEGKKEANLTMNNGDVFIQATILEYYEDQKGNDEVSFTCIEEESMLDIDYDDEDIYEFLDEDIIVKNYIVKHIFKVDQIAGVSITTLDLSKGFSAST